jgi:thiosulfate/3-mercaptopyruvate sulfurtransferase
MSPNHSALGPLIAPVELVAMLDQPSTRVCDVRWYLADPQRGEAEYLDGHIPGAVFVDLDTRLSARRGGGRHPLPDPIRFAATLGRLGISPESRVVVYDSAGGAIAARMWWMLRKLGHRHVAVLDGGWQAWHEEGHPIERDVDEPAPVSYPVLMSSWPDIVGMDEIVGAEHGTVVDARAPERYSGEVENVDARPGHIPGAINLPHTGNLRADGRYRSRPELAERFRDLGERPIMYCGSGVTACANLLAMEIAGLDEGMLYPGSWSEWADDPGLPAELGT